MTPRLATLVAEQPYGAEPTLFLARRARYTLHECISRRAGTLVLVNDLGFNSRCRAIGVSGFIKYRHKAAATLMVLLQVILSKTRGPIPEMACHLREWKHSPITSPRPVPRRGAHATNLPLRAAEPPRYIFELKERQWTPADCRLGSAAARYTTAKRRLPAQRSGWRVFHWL